ncbi:MAG: DUF4168 domain-containing protein [Acetobacterales bacterium]
MTPAIDARLRAAALALLVALSPAAGALAQDAPHAAPQGQGALPQDRPGQSPQQTRRRVLTEEKLVAFAVAARKVRVVREAWEAKIEKAESKEAADALKEEANKEFARVVTEAPGITVPEYLGIVEAAEDNPELGKKINEVIQATQAP